MIIVIIAIIPLFTKLASKYMIAILLSIIIIQSFKIGIAWIRRGTQAVPAIIGEAFGADRISSKCLIQT